MEAPVAPAALVYGYVVRCDEKASGKSIRYVLSIGFPSLNCLNVLRQASTKGVLRMDLLFVTSALHITLWPKLAALTRLLPPCDRPIDCQSVSCAQLPAALLPQTICAWLPVFSMTDDGSLLEKSGKEGLPTLETFLKNRGELDPQQFREQQQRFAEHHTMDKTQTDAFFDTCRCPIVLVQVCL